MAQLTVDLLVSSLLKEGTATLVGRISSSFLRPIVGPNAFDLFNKNVMTSCEVYESLKYKLVIVQLRSPPFSRVSSKFVSSLFAWIKEASFSKVVVLTSSFSQFLTPTNPNEGTNPVRFLSGSSIDGIEPLTKVEEYSLKPSETGVIKIPGSGFALKLYRSCEEGGFQTQLLVKYCSEGDNTPDAYHLMSVLNSVIKVRPTSEKSTWIVPVSWNKLYGEDHPETLF